MSLIIEKTKQNWDIKIHNKIKHCPYFIVDNWYTEEEEKRVWSELDFYSHTEHAKIEKAENTVVARDNDGISKSNAYRFHMWDYYTPKGQNISHIMNCLYKQRSIEFHDIVKNALPQHYNNFIATDTDGTMISYYDKAKYYKSHSDTVQFTCLIWLYKQPKRFFGGNLKLIDGNATIECISNRMILFPSYLQHEVTEVKSKEDIEFGYGRYCMTHFYNWTGRV